VEVSSRIVAKKYAVAFLNQYFNELSTDYIKRLSTLGRFLKKNRYFYIYLLVPSVPVLEKQKALSRIAQAFDLEKSTKKLMFVLLDHGRIEILDNVLHQIIFYYRRRKNIQLYRITISHPITKKEECKVIDFIKHIAPTAVVADFVVDQSLISGFRVQSNTFLWERSISKQLRDVRRSIFKRVGLW